MNDGHQRARSGADPRTASSRRPARTVPSSSRSSRTAKSSANSSTTWQTMSISRASTREPSRATRTSRWTASPVRNRVWPASAQRWPAVAGGAGLGGRGGHRDSVPDRYARRGPGTHSARLTGAVWIWMRSSPSTAPSGTGCRCSPASAARKLTAAEVDELVVLYRRTATHLSVVRSRSADPTLVAWLSRLVLQARAAVTPSSGFSGGRGPVLHRLVPGRGLPGRAAGASACRCVPGPVSGVLICDGRQRPAIALSLPEPGGDRRARQPTTSRRTTRRTRRRTSPPSCGPTTPSSARSAWPAVC